MSVTEPDHDPLVGQVVGSYRVEKLIGKGGMGAVYRASHQTIRKRVALKVLLPEFTSRADISARFIQEAMSASHVVGLDGNTHRTSSSPSTPARCPMVGSSFLSSTWRASISRRTSRRGGRLAEMDPSGSSSRPAPRRCRTQREGSRTAGSRRSYRDIKPPNQSITRDDLGRPVKLLDFGIAKVASAMRETGTGAGTMMGSPAYMARVCFAALRRWPCRHLRAWCGDYRLLTGRLLHNADNARGFILAKQEQQVILIVGFVPDVAVCGMVVARCLTWEPDNRYRNVRMLVGDLVDGRPSALPTRRASSGRLALVPCTPSRSMRPREPVAR
jgi:serine/threonine-protein kinase